MASNSTWPTNGETNWITSWDALAVDGFELSSADTETFERVNERGGARRLRFSVDGYSDAFHVACGPDESIHLFTRRGILYAATPDARQVNMPVAEVRRQDGTFTRLYVHPDHGVILSTLDLNL